MGRERTIRAVLDTNVLVGSQRLIFLYLARHNRFELVSSNFILHEMLNTMHKMYCSVTVYLMIQI